MNIKKHPQQIPAGEFALFCLGYNFERAKNLLGFGKMMELMVKA